jgi:hypothetical protein
VPPVPNRYQVVLPVESPFNDDQTLFPYNTPRAELLEAIFSAGLTERKVAAVRALYDQSITDLSWWAKITAVAEAAEKVRTDETDPAFRRYALTRMFTACADVRKRLLVMVILDDNEKFPIPAWPAIKRLRIKLRSDKDPLVREFMERYENAGPPVPWQKAKYLSLLQGAAVAQKYSQGRGPGAPVMAAYVAQLNGMCEKDEKKLLFKIEDYTKRAKGLPPKLRKLVTAEIRRHFEHQIYRDWSNLYPLALAEQLTADEAGAMGIAPKPLREGWPSWPDSL